MDNLKEKTARGLFWSLMNSGSTQVLNLVIGIVLARLLTPDDYGIVGVLTIFTAIGGALQASGFSNALINLREPTSRDYTSVFWFNVIASTAIYTVLFMAAPLIARFFHQPCLTAVSRLVFLTLPISALGITLNVWMTKNMMNREMAVSGIVSLVASGAVGITLAILGYTYWSLACQQVAYSVVLNLCRYYYVRWRPEPHLDFGPVRRMFGFSMNVLTTHIVNILNQNILTFAFGRLFAIGTVGNYSQANKWNTMAHSLITNAIGQLSQTVFASVTDDNDREIRVFRKMMRFTSFLCFPLMLGLALTAREFILLTIGEKWEDSVMLLQILAVGSSFAPLYILFQHLIMSRGHSSVYMWCSVGQVTVQLIFVVTLARLGIVTLVTAYSALTVAWLAVWQTAAHKLVGIRLADTMRDVLPFLTVALATMAATYVITMPIAPGQSKWSCLLLLTVRIIVAAALYCGTLRLLHARVLEECITFLKSKRNNPGT